MKVFEVVMKVIATLAAIAALIFVIIKYGDKISAWGKGLLAKLGLCCGEEVMEVPAEEVPQEAAPAEDQAAEEDFEATNE